MYSSCHDQPLLGAGDATFSELDGQPIDAANSCCYYYEQMLSVFYAVNKTSEICKKKTVFVVVI